MDLLSFTTARTLFHTSRLVDGSMPVVGSSWRNIRVEYMCSQCSANLGIPKDCLTRHSSRIKRFSQRHLRALLSSFSAQRFGQCTAWPSVDGGAMVEKNTQPNTTGLSQCACKNSPREPSQVPRGVRWQQRASSSFLRCTFSQFCQHRPPA